MFLTLSTCVGQDIYAPAPSPQHIYEISKWTVCECWGLEKDALREKERARIKTRADVFPLAHLLTVLFFFFFTDAF